MAAVTKTVVDWTCDGCGHADAMEAVLTEQATGQATGQAPAGWREITVGTPGNHISDHRHLCNHCAEYLGFLLDGSFEARVTGEKHIAWNEGRTAHGGVANPYAEWVEPAEVDPAESSEG